MKIPHEYSRDSWGIIFAKHFIYSQKVHVENPWGGVYSGIPQKQSTQGEPYVLLVSSLKRYGEVCQ